MATGHLSERDARLLTHHVVEELHRLGAVVRHCGVQVEGAGLLFLAEINGRLVGCLSGGGVVSYQTIATGLLAASVDRAIEES